MGKHLKPGDMMTAADWNTVQDYALMVPELVRKQPIRHQRDTNLITVENTTGENLDVFSVVAISDAMFPDRNPQTVIDNALMNGVELAVKFPSDSPDEILCVLQPPPPADEIGKAILLGATLCYIEFSDEAALNFPYAIPIAGYASRLKASPYGRIRILWHEAAKGGYPQTLQAYVLLGDDCQWAIFKLRGDLKDARCVDAVLVDNDGNELSQTAIIQQVWGTAGTELPEGTVVLCWWFQALGRWVAAPSQQEVYPYTFGTLGEDLNLFSCEGGARVEFATCVVSGTSESGGSAWETSNIFSVFQNFGQLKLPLNLMQMPNFRMPVWRFPQWLFPAWYSVGDGGGSGGSPNDIRVYGTGSFSDFDWWLPKGTPVTCAYNPIAMRWEVMDFYIPDFFGTLNSDLQKDSCAAVSLRQGRFDGQSTLIACAPPGMICQGEKIESGESVLIRWFHPQKQWYVIAASCPCESAEK